MASGRVQLSGASRWRRIRGALTPAEWRRAAMLAAVIVGLHVVGFFLLFAVVVPHHYSLGASGVFGVGIGHHRLHARPAARVRRRPHRRDRQHDAQADERGPAPAERRLLLLARPLDDRVRARRAWSSIGVRGLSGAVENDGSTLHQATGLIGPTVSGTFLFVIGILNLVVLISIVRIFRRMRQGDYDEAELEDQLDAAAS